MVYLPSHWLNDAPCVLLLLTYDTTRSCTNGASHSAWWWPRMDRNTPWEISKNVRLSLETRDFLLSLKRIYKCRPQHPDHVLLLGRSGPQFARGPGKPLLPTKELQRLKTPPEADLWAATMLYFYTEVLISTSVFGDSGLRVWFHSLLCLMWAPSLEQLPVEISLFASYTCCLDWTEAGELDLAGCHVPSTWSRNATMVPWYTWYMFFLFFFSIWILFDPTYDPVFTFDYYVHFILDSLAFYLFFFLDPFLIHSRNTAVFPLSHLNFIWLYVLL